MPQATPPTFGRYRVIQPLGAGGMAEVFLARAEGPMGFAKKLVVKRMSGSLRRPRAIDARCFIPEEK